MARQSKYPELKNAGDVPNMASQIRNTTQVGHPLYVPPSSVPTERDVEMVLADTLDMLAQVMTTAAMELRDVLERRYISVEEAAELSAKRGKKPKRRPKKGATAVDREVVRAAFGRVVAFQYDKAVALLDAYSAMHFDEIKDEHLNTFYEATINEINDFPEDYVKVEEDFDDES